MSYKGDIGRLERELRIVKAKQGELEANCNHEWDETKFEPEYYKEPQFSHYEGHGSDPNPVYTYCTKSKDRWKRKCNKCGKVEFTYVQAPTKYEPKF
jgi:hypothetical protein